jgi:hypothetical protein
MYYFVEQTNLNGVKNSDQIEINPKKKEIIEQFLIIHNVESSKSCR